MDRLRQIWILSLFLAYIAVSPARAFQKDSLLLELNNVIEHRDEFVQAKRERLEELHRVLRKNNISDIERFAVLQQLSTEYSTFIYDSAFKYIGELQTVAYRLNDPSKIAYG
jgi:hypothetical protein